MDCGGAELSALNAPLSRGGLEFKQVPMFRRLRIPLLIVSLIALAAITQWLAPLAQWPDRWDVPFNTWINVALNAIDNARLIDGITLQTIFGGVVPVIQWPVSIIDQVIDAGFTRGFGDNQVQICPPISWASITILATCAVWRVAGLKVALLAFTTCCYLLTTALWSSTMMTLAQLAIAVPLSIVLGFAGGLLIHRFKFLEGGMLLLLNQMQTIPLFAYLVPIIMFFGIGTAPGVIAVVIFAAPSMVRATALGLNQAEQQFSELATGIGCTRRQALWHIMVPGAQTALLLGLNQVVMLSFSTVILAALVGAQGVGNDVLIALQRLAIGRGLEAGLAITLVAIVLDRFFHALVVRKRRAAQRISAPLFWGTAGGAAFGLTLLSFAVPQLAHFPDEWTISTANTVDLLVSFLINIIYAPVTAVQTVVIIYGLMPLKHGLEALPWAFVTGVVFIFAYLAGGLRRAIELSFLVSLIAFAGLWDRAMQTFYLSFMGVALAAAAGFPLGILAAKHPRLGQIILPLTDTLQTLPGFIYLIPAIMLFGTGDVPCIFAISAFAICPAIRYTEAALRSQPRSLDEVGRQFGCGPLQRLFKIELPAALPQLLLGLSQVVLMALAMVVVTSLIGTTDLGEAVMLAVNQADSGQALAAGIAVAIIGIVVDRLLTDRANLIIKQRSRAQ